jgi:type II secretory ATPase GspE/PulE/Tfp pilus assembly ATPase PilB-like protein
VLAEAAADHTILVGLRATDTTQALARLAEMMSDRAALASRLRIIVSQRLVRLLCPDCKEAYRPNPEFLRKANLGARRVDVLYRPPARPAVEKDKVVVCPRCHNDRYIGRTGLFEVMVVDPEMADLIAAGAGPADLRTHARKFGLRNLQEEGLELVTRGETSIEEVLRAIKMEA